MTMSKFLRNVDVHLQLIPEEENLTLEEYVEFLYAQKDKLLEWAKTGAGLDAEVSHVVVKPQRGAAVLSFMRFETPTEERQRASVEYAAKVERREMYDALKEEFEDDEV